MDQATALFSSIVGLAGIKQLVADRVKEDLALEFKHKKHPASPDLDEGDRMSFSEALSGFANSDGGVLVWGIRTDRRDGEDRAAELAPIGQVGEFASRLAKSLINAVQPFVDGVEIETVEDDEQPDSGYVKVLIPRSEKAPHRAMLSAREYYKRSTEGFYRMEHFDLEDAFGRRPHPALRLEAAFTESEAGEVVQFWLQNVGRGIAKHVGMLCRFGPGITLATVNPPLKNLSALNAGAPLVQYDVPGVVIHPMPSRVQIGSAVITRAEKGSPLTLTASVYCEGMSPRTYEVNVPVTTKYGDGERLEE